MAATGGIVADEYAADKQADKHKPVADLSALVSTEASATLHAVTNLLLDSAKGIKTNVAEAVNAASHQMDLSSACHWNWRWDWHWDSC